MGAPGPREPRPDVGARRDARQRRRREPRRARPAGVGVPRGRVRGAAGAGHRRLHRPVLGRSAGAGAAARRRRLDDEAVPSGGGHRARGGRRAAPPCGRRRRGGRAGPERRADDPRRPLPGLRPRALARPDPARVRAHPAPLGSGGPGARARGDLPARVGLRDGPRRPQRRRLRPQAPPEAREGIAACVAVHPHALRRRLPVRRRAGGRGGPEAPGPAERVAPPVVDGAVPPRGAAAAGPTASRAHLRRSRRGPRSPHEPAGSGARSVALS